MAHIGPKSERKKATRTSLASKVAKTKDQPKITNFFLNPTAKRPATCEIEESESAKRKQISSSHNSFEQDIGYDSHEKDEESVIKSKETYKRMGGIFSKKPDLKRSGASLATLEAEEYLLEYPNWKDNHSIQENKKFYFNEIRCEPDGDFIDEIHQKWFKDYRLLESHHGYIQWLFPLRERGMNYHAQPLQTHEAEAIKNNEEAKKRVLKSYRLMLDFYGIKLVNEDTGKVTRAENWIERFYNLNRSYHNYLRITRILKSLGELGYEHLKAPLVKFLLDEAVDHGTLKNIEQSCCEYFVYTLRNEAERVEIIDWIKHFSKFGVK